MNAVRGMAVAILCMFAMCGLARADGVPTLVLDPLGGAISGAAGATIGWGFTLTNPGVDFLVVTSSDFCVGVITSPCSNSLGSYTDFAGPQFIVAGPSPENPSVTQAFDNTLLTGMGSFLINPGATGSVTGEIVLTYDLYSVDPNSPSFDPTVDTVALGDSLLAGASVTVGAVTTPEPPAGLLLGTALIALTFFARKRRTDPHSLSE
jgi:hypothetical protein